MSWEIKINGSQIPTIVLFIDMLRKRKEVMENSNLVRRYKITSNYMKSNQWKFEVK